jgi:5-methylthioribose kinase
VYAFSKKFNNYFAMTTVSTETLVLNEESIPSYLAERADAIGVLPPNAILTAKPITGGNVNFAFCVSNTVENGSNSPDVRTAVFVKQAPEYVTIFGPGRQSW